MHNKTNNSHTNIEDLITEANQWQRKAPSRSCMEFRPISRDFVVLGSDDGSVELFGTNDMKIVCTLKSFQKLIQSLAWHPPSKLKLVTDHSALKLEESAISKVQKHIICIFKIGKKSIFFTRKRFKTTKNAILNFFPVQKMIFCHF